MKHLTEDDYVSMLRILTHDTRQLRDDKTLPVQEKQVKVCELWLLQFTGSNYQEAYIEVYVNALMNFIRGKCNEILIN